MRHIAVIGSGPAGYYTAEAAQKKYGDDVRVDIIDRLPVPYGLIRFGVAPVTNQSRRLPNAMKRSTWQTMCALSAMYRWGMMLALQSSRASTMR
jgi:2-polyprenyl-6-methoxyphenol hydroxylase-like FAD-dependent oxidoreductase